MPVSPARSAAFGILLRVEREASYAAELLHASSCERLSRRDHALATELVMGVLRWRSVLDEKIGVASSQPLAKLDPEVLIALRLAAYQLLNLDRVPQRAAIHESVELIKRARKRSAVPFVNAVLRKIAARPIASDNDAEENSSHTLARRFAHPVWLVERWLGEYGLAATRRICEYDQSIPRSTIRLRASGAEAELANEGITLAAGGLLASARRVDSGDITKTDAVRASRIVIQDEGSQLIAALVAAGGSYGDGLRILDCCAAPGGKTLAISDHNPAAQVAAVEIQPHRARLMKKLLPENTHAEIVVADARQLPLMGNFACVLADVPCSGTGTLARNPEIKWRLRPDDLSDLHERQVAILRSALEQVASGGRLVYSTCSLEKEENEDVVEKAVSGNNSFRRVDCRRELEQLQSAGELTWEDPTSLCRGPYLRTIPGVHPCDGFFGAILEKK